MVDGAVQNGQYSRARLQALYGSVHISSTFYPAVLVAAGKAKIAAKTTFHVHCVVTDFPLMCACRNDINERSPIETG
ncbi:hypothetical protein [Massilia psychrophila]|uniref:hypothetical protein n=1 Tax=Massilia psychrophila TaxID=1603353 RepID=UPI00117CD6AF|nr:hypothetical protein [Massilia psychrophila]GGE69549.1 hypothetical protein GCM10008020_12550 [Massilia psychrophila]